MLLRKLVAALHFLNAVSTDSAPCHQPAVLRRSRARLAVRIYRSRRPGVSAFRADCRLTAGEECEKTDGKETDANYDYPNRKSLLLSKLAAFGT